MLYKHVVDISGNNYIHSPDNQRSSFSDVTNNEETTPYILYSIRIILIQ